MSITIDGTGIVLLPVSPDELASLIRTNVRAELEARFPDDPPGGNSERESTDDLLTVEETRALLDVARVTLNDWEKKGILSPVRLGRRVYYRRGDIYAALQDETTITGRKRRTAKTKG